ncbi:MAG: DUF523 and DUF1722 domain-containing protein [Methanotrichaceae archaeon]|nr:DUF523 and DUF1722 domain-containing protein [Methanotrichaceae archaeon]
MRQFVRPKVVISKCIEFAHCRYDGSMIPSDFVKALKPHIDFKPVCAEMEIGLGVPRSTVRIASVNGELRLIQPTTDLDLTDKMRAFSSQFLSSLAEVDGFILKFRSPSCGLKDIKIYSGIVKTGTVSKAAGFFGGEVIKSFPDLAIEDEGRLRNFNIREHFLTKLYALASFRKIRNNRDLIQFHQINKFLLMAYSQKETKILGNLVANHEGMDFMKQTGLYREHLAKALKRPPSTKSKANVLMKSLGYFSNQLTLQEKDHFIHSIEWFKDKKIPSSALLAMLQSWAVRFDQDYVKNQTFFEPFPEDLIELCRDSQCEWAGEELFIGRGNRKTKDL